MPNHCTNQLTCEDGNFKTIIKPFLTKDDAGNYFLDFNKIVPRPEDLNITASFGTTDEELKEKYKSNLEKYGFENWYDWSIANWGTKWNSYDTNLNKNGMSFYTAWSPPIPVITELAKKTGKTFILEYMDEGMGFIGRLTASPEEVIDECYDSPDDAPEELKESLGYEPYEDED